MKRLGPWIACTLLALAPLASAQDETLASPRKTVQAFLDSVYEAAKGDDEMMTEAMHCLDLTGISAMRQEIGRKRVLQLKAIFDRINLIGQDRSRIPDTPDGGVPAGEPYVLYQDPEGVGQIELVRLNEEWRFSDYTLQVAVPDLVEAIEKRIAAEEAIAALANAEAASANKTYPTVSAWLRAHMPEPMLQRAVALEYWQWAGLGLLVILGAIVDKIVIVVLLLLIVAILRTQKMDVDKALTRKSLRPFAMLCMALFWWAGLNWLGLPSRALAVASVLVKFVTAVAGVWGAYRLVDVLCSALERKAAKSVSKFDDLLVPLIRKSSKVFIVLFGLVFVVDAMGISVSGMLTGLGLGGLAFALAAQDTVKNFFGSLTVVLDRPFEVGDWVLIDGVEGSIEEVGFRSTRIRTFYQSVITIPNAKLLTAVVDNMGARRYRRWKTKIGVTYDTPPDTLEAFCEGIRELVRQHPSTRKDYFQCYVVGFADSAIEILLYVFFDTPNWGRELQEKQRMILDVMRLAESMGVEFAFPTQTLHVANGGFLASAPAPAAAAAAGASSSPPPRPEEEEAPASARTVGRHAATSLLSKQRLRAALEVEERAAEKEAATAAASALSTPDAGRTGTADSERLLKELAGKNWPTRGEVADADDGDGGGEG